LDNTLGGLTDAFVARLNATGTALIYATYLGGGNLDFGAGIRVDADNNAYVTGGTSSADFPVTPGSFDTSFNGASDVFVSKLNPTGSMLLYSTFVGGSEQDSGRALDLDAA